MNKKEKENKLKSWGFIKVLNNTHETYYYKKDTRIVLSFYKCKTEKEMIKFIIDYVLVLGRNNGEIETQNKIKEALGFGVEIQL